MKIWENCEENLPVEPASIDAHTHTHTKARPREYFNHHKHNTAQRILHDALLQTCECFVTRAFMNKIN